MSVTYTISPLDSPFQPLLNPYVEEAERHTQEWILNFQFATDEEVLKRFYASKFGWLSGRTFPHAGLEELFIVSDWNAWLFIFDDQCDRATVGKNTSQLRAFSDRMLEILQENKRLSRNEAEPLAISLSELWERMRQKGSIDWQRRFIRSFAEYTEACIWEANNRATGAVPTLMKYKKMRPYTGAMYTEIELIDITEKIDLPEYVREHELVKKLSLLCNTTVCWANDIYSYTREMKQGDVHNLVLAIQHKYKLSLQEAVLTATQVHNEEVRLYVELEKRLPSFGAENDAQLARYLGVLRSWMRGHIDWAKYDTRRYVL